MPEEGLFWTKVAAIGQVAGAVATFFAVVTALWIARQEQRTRVRVRARTGKVVSSHGPVSVISVSVEKVGLRSVKINSIGWIGGLPTWKFPKPLRALVPEWLSQVTLFQMPEYDWHINDNFPWRLAPGESKSTHFRYERFLSEFKGKQGAAFFRRVPLVGRTVPIRPRVYVSVDTRPMTIGRIDQNLVEAMRKAFDQ